MSAAPRAMHVERTGDPAVLRWVCHEESLAAAVPGPRTVPDSSPLGRLVGAGSLVDVTVRQGDILVRACDSDAWSTLAPLVRDALRAELDVLEGSTDHWLVTAVHDNPAPPTIEDVQRIVERSAGAITAMHGGAMTVVAVESDTVRLRAQGACDGCRQSDDTALAIIAPAIRAEYPQLAEVVVEASEPAHSSPMTDWVRLRRP